MKWPFILDWLNMPRPPICAVLLSLILAPLHLVENPGMRRVLSLVLSSLSDVICCYCSVHSCSLLIVGLFLYLFIMWNVFCSMFLFCILQVSRSYFLWCYVLGVAFVVAMFGVDASFGSFCWTFSCCFVQIFSLVWSYSIPVLFLSVFQKEELYWLSKKPNGVTLPKLMVSPLSGCHILNWFWWWWYYQVILVVWN